MSPPVVRPQKDQMRLQSKCVGNICFYVSFLTSPLTNPAIWWSLQTGVKTHRCSTHRNDRGQEARWKNGTTNTANHRPRLRESDTSTNTGRPWWQETDDDFLCLLRPEKVPAAGVAEKNVLCALLLKKNKNKDQMWFSRESDRSVKMRAPMFSWADHSTARVVFSAAPRWCHTSLSELSDSLGV